ncbi:MAG: 2-oxoacid:acceptor oxidoreductase family protein [Candidatus Parcubacteria bacterium]|nr:2-oxoacid:acceptor oxidoreductase family protein [Candidatus Parcubacteria bacterium]
MAKMQIRFTGVGGQGIITAGDILCDAAIKEGKHSVKISTYTSQVRGGPTVIDVLCNEEEIYYPYAIDGEINFMLSVADSSYQIFKKGVRPGSIIVIDPNLVHPTDDDRKTWRIIEIPVVEIAKKEIGYIATQSTIALGIAVHVTKCVNTKVLLGSILEKIPKKSKEANMKAFELGIKYAEERCK